MKPAVALGVLFRCRAFAESIISRNDNTCAEGLLIIGIRGTNEAPGPGYLGSSIGDFVAKQVRSTEVIGLDYPATMMNPKYTVSAANGTAGLKSLLTLHSQQCPDSKIALVGFSQGSQIVMDTICGADEKGFPRTAAISTAMTMNNIVAITLFADPTFVADAPFDRGTSKSNGIFARGNTKQCHAYFNIITSYCDATDVVCAGGRNIAIHNTAHYEKYASDASQFIVDMYNAASGLVGNHSTATATMAVSPASLSNYPSNVGNTQDVPSAACAYATLSICQVLCLIIVSLVL